VEPETGIRYTEASVDIHRDQVEEYFSEFNCACVAISAKGSVVSKYALVTNACKNFYFYFFEIFCLHSLVGGGPE
jgi:hypothetical protein